MTLGKIEHIELELTSRCNASCSVCPRFYNGSLNPYFQTTDLSLQDLKNINEDIWQTIKTVVLKGTVGDAGSCPELLSILEFLNQKDLDIYFHTNGAVKTAEWWSNLGKNISRIRTRFCLDGIDEDTHLTYRKTSFTKVIENAKAYIAAGGDAEWFFIIFKHNEDQIEHAIELATHMGFKNFIAAYSDRYEQSDNTQIPTNFSYDNSQKKIKISEYKIFKWPTNDLNVSNFYNTDLKKTKKINVCPNLATNTIYIAADGLVWPCCYYGSSNLTRDQLFWNFYSKKILQNDFTSMNIKHNTLDNIMKSDIWQWWDDYVIKFNPKKCLQYCG